MFAKRKRSDTTRPSPIPSDMHSIKRSAGACSAARTTAVSISWLTADGQASAMKGERKKERIANQKRREREDGGGINGLIVPQNFSSGD
jgi:hypothetical protein